MKTHRVALFAFGLLVFPWVAFAETPPTACAQDNAKAAHGLLATLTFQLESESSSTVMTKDIPISIKPGIAPCDGSSSYESTGNSILTNGSTTLTLAATDQFYLDVSFDQNQVSGVFEVTVPTSFVTALLQPFGNLTFTWLDPDVDSALLIDYAPGAWLSQTDLFPLQNIGDGRVMGIATGTDGSRYTVQLTQFSVIYN